MSWAEKITKAIVYGILTGTAFYVVGGIAAPYVAGITPVVTAAIGFTGAFAIAMFPNDE